MAFFEDIGESLGRFGKTIAGRARNAVDTGNLKIQISNAQKEVTKAYAELGKKYVEMNPEGMHENLKPFLDAVSAAVEKVKTLEQEV